MRVEREASLRLFTTLKAGGRADRLVRTRDVDDLATATVECQALGESCLVLGWGSNALPSDAGVRGTVVVNGSRAIQIQPDHHVVVDSGVGLQNLYLAAAQAGLTGLEFAVGIPGSVGGALVSNAGAYRSDISRLTRRVEVVESGIRKWVDSDWMAFNYRDSRFRQKNLPSATILRVELEFTPGDPKSIYDAGREWQRQRIGKQPPSASAGSFFKNVVNSELAQRIEGLTPGMRESGVIPAGFLIEACGLKGARLGGAMIGARHANFLLNVGGASATELRSLAFHARRRVHETFGVEVEEEVLYVGDWSGFTPLSLPDGS